MPGNRPASVRPRKNRAVIKPWKLWTSPIVVMQIPHKIIMLGMKMLGLSLFSRTLVKGSASE